MRIWVSLLLLIGLAGIHPGCIVFRLYGHPAVANPLSPVFDFVPTWQAESDQAGTDLDASGRVDAKDLLQRLKGEDLARAKPFMIAAVIVPAGTFEMGNPGSAREVAGSFSNEFPRHTVTIAYPIEVGTLEISNEIFVAALNLALSRGILRNSAAQPYTGGDVYLNGRRLVVISNPYCDIEFNGTSFEVKDRKGVSVANHPACFITWYGAIAFCNWISEENGLIACYDLNNGSLTNPGGGGYRLPSESEWEYFCRGPVSNPHRYSPFSFGDDETLRLESCDSSSVLNAFMAWCGSESDWSEEVGKRLPNSFGIHDLHGNVWEWCQDVWHADYNGAPVDGRAWEAPGGPYRVVRGGSWTYQAARCRSSARDYNDPQKGDFFIGFRVVRTLQP